MTDIYESDFSIYPMYGSLSKIDELVKIHGTPTLFLDLSVVRNKYQLIKKYMPKADIYYAIKSNPNKDLLKMLVSLGSSFDVASIYELDTILECGVDPKKLSYGNTIKKARDIKYFYEKGVRLFVTDCIEDLKNIEANAPGSNVFFRIISDSNSADWPLSRKFGAYTDTIYNLIIESKSMNVIPYGLSFHVGSQQRNIGEWDDAIAKCRFLFTSLKEEQGIELKMINLGGGLPAKYITPAQEDKTYFAEINRYIEEDFGDEIPRLLIEPGRGLVGDCGIIVSEIVLISQKTHTDLHKWVYLDIGKFSGLIETINESIKYPILFRGNSPEQYKAIIAGPTCDSMDIMYEEEKYLVPSDVKNGDKVYIFTTGAYTSSYSAIEFNGFPPLKVVTI